MLFELHIKDIKLKYFISRCVIMIFYDDSKPIISKMIIACVYRYD